MSDKMLSALQGTWVEVASNIATAERRGKGTVERLYTIVGGLAALSFMISLIGWPLAKLIRAEGGRRLFRRGAVISFAVVMSTSFMQVLLEHSPASKHGDPSAATATAASGSATNSVCEDGAPTGKDYKVTGHEIPVRSGPGSTFEQIVNQKATAALGKTEYLLIDASFTVREICRSGEWAKIETITPAWLASTHRGWVQSKHLISPEQRASKGFVEEDFVFNEDTRLWKKIIIEGVNRIAREDERCKEIDPGTADIAPDGTKANPRFFVTCDASETAVNVFFTKADVEKGRVFKAPTWINHQIAVDACEAAAKASATHPSTVDFSRFMDIAIQDYSDGVTVVKSTFSAKNGFNLQLKYDIICRFDSSGFVGTPQIAESN